MQSQGEKREWRVQEWQGIHMGTARRTGKWQRRGWRDSRKTSKSPWRVWACATGRGQIVEAPRWSGREDGITEAAAREELERDGARGMDEAAMTQTNSVTQRLKRGEPPRRRRNSKCSEAIVQQSTDWLLRGYVGGRTHQWLPDCQLGMEFE